MRDALFQFDAGSLYSSLESRWQGARPEPDKARNSANFEAARLSSCCLWVLWVSKRQLSCGSVPSTRNCPVLAGDEPSGWLVIASKANLMRPCDVCAGMPALHCSLRVSGCPPLSAWGDPIVSAGLKDSVPCAFLLAHRRTRSQ